MSIFVPNKVYLRGILLHYFIQKKSAAEAHRILVQTYGDNALSDTTCRDWFRCFKNNDFELEDKERSAAPKKFEDKELEQLLDEDPSQTLSELGKILQVDESTVSKRLKELGMIQKQGNWVPYELKPRDVERRFGTCELLLQRQKRNGFYNMIKGAYKANCPERLKHLRTKTFWWSKELSKHRSGIKVKTSNIIFTRKYEPELLELWDKKINYTSLVKYIKHFSLNLRAALWLTCMKAYRKDNLRVTTGAMRAAPTEALEVVLLSPSLSQVIISTARQTAYRLMCQDEKPKIMKTYIESSIVWKCMQTLAKLGETNKITLVWIPEHQSVSKNEKVTG
ncbi:MOS1T transposase, partial [Pseudoatta argentina]